MTSISVHACFRRADSLHLIISIFLHRANRHQDNVELDPPRPPRPPRPPLGIAAAPLEKRRPLPRLSGTSAKSSPEGGASARDEKDAPHSRGGVSRQADQRLQAKGRRNSFDSPDGHIDIICVVFESLRSYLLRLPGTLHDVFHGAACKLSFLYSRGVICPERPHRLTGTRDLLRTWRVASDVFLIVLDRRVGEVHDGHLSLVDDLDHA
jgi:hypothetical protein